MAIATDRRIVDYTNTNTEEIIVYTVVTTTPRGSFAYPTPSLLEAIQVFRDARRIGFQASLVTLTDHTGRIRLRWSPPSE